MDVLHMLSCTTGRNRTTFKLNDGRDRFSIEMTSITAPQSQPITRILAGVDHIFYVVSLCSYCANLSGVSSRNQMEASLELFSLMSRLEILRHTKITIFFTQADIFPQRIIDVPIWTRFWDFPGGRDAQAAYQFFVREFRRRDTRRDAELHIFAPGLDGSVSLNDTLDTLQSGILQALRPRQPTEEEEDLGEVIGLAI